MKSIREAKSRASKASISTVEQNLKGKSQFSQGRREGEGRGVRGRARLFGIDRRANTVEGTSEDASVGEERRRRVEK